MIINPDNPSGNLLSKDEIFVLVEWSERKGIRLIIDESFLDFANPEKKLSLLDKELLNKYPHLIVIRAYQSHTASPDYD